jgi:hypothetical protein
LLIWFFSVSLLQVLMAAMWPVAAGKHRCINQTVLLHKLLHMLQVLIEAGQRLPDGRLRQRGLPLSEKMIGQEDWQAAAVRAVSEELATALPQDWRQQVRLLALWCSLAAVQRSAKKSQQRFRRTGGSR